MLVKYKTTETKSLGDNSPLIQSVWDSLRKDSESPFEINSEKQRSVEKQTADPPRVEIVREEVKEETKS